MNESETGSRSIVGTRRPRKKRGRLEKNELTRSRVEPGIHSREALFCLTSQRVTTFCFSNVLLFTCLLVPLSSKGAPTSLPASAVSVEGRRSTYVDTRTHRTHRCTDTGVECGRYDGGRRGGRWEMLRVVSSQPRCGVIDHDRDHARCRARHPERSFTFSGKTLVSDGTHSDGPCIGVKFIATPATCIDTSDSTSRGDWVPPACVRVYACSMDIIINIDMKSRPSNERMNGLCFEFENAG